MTNPLRWLRPSIRLTVPFLAVFLLLGCQKSPDLALTFQLAAGSAPSSGAALEEARHTVRQRLGQLGVRPAVVETAGGDRIVVRLAREDDSPRLRHLLETPGVFELRFVRLPTGGEPPSSQEEVLAQLGGKLPEDLEILEQAIRSDAGNASARRFYAVEKRPVLTNRDIRSARPGMGQFGGPVVEFRVKPEPAKGFAEATGAHIGSLLAIVLDGRLVSALKINAKIRDAGGIEGGFTQEQALDTAILLRSDPLRGRLTIVEERTEKGGGR